MSLRIKVKESSESLLKAIKAEKNEDKKDKLKLLKMVSDREVSEIKEVSKKLIRHVNTISSWLKEYRTGGIKKRELSRKLCLGVKPQIKNLLKFINMIFNMRYRIKLPLIIHFFNK